MPLVTPLDWFNTKPSSSQLDMQELMHIKVVSEQYPQELLALQHSPTRRAYTSHLGGKQSPTFGLSLSHKLTASSNSGDKHQTNRQPA